MTLTEQQKSEFTIGVGMLNVGSRAVTMTPEALLQVGGDFIGKIVQTHETYADFAKTHRSAQASRTTAAGHEIHVWHGVQFRKGAPRGDLYLMEFDGVSASMYTGG